MPTRIRLLGELRVERGDTIDRGSDLGSRKGRTVLALLAAEPARTHSAASIVSALWPAGAPEHAEATVASLVSRLRRRLGPAAIIGGRGGYQLAATPEVDVDLAEAERLVNEAERRGAAGQPGLAAAAGHAAWALLEGGVALDGEDDLEWVRAARDAQTALLRRSLHASAAAALAIGDDGGARRACEAALALDPLDEEAVRGLLAALAVRGEVGTALGAYERLRGLLAEELGADPAPATRQLHESILRGEASGAGSARPGGTPRTPRPALLGLAGREAELLVLEHAWEDAAAGSGSVVLLAGQPGAGKTRLAEELAILARATGGAVVTTRCYEAEKALFLQPLVDAIRTVVASWPTGVVRKAASEQADSLTRLVPELRSVVGGGVPPRAGRPDVEHRRTIEGVAAFLCGLAASGPLLLLVDDLHNAGWSTVELLHYLRTRLRTTPLLVVATVREGVGAPALDALADVTDRVDVGPLRPAAVQALAAAAGQAQFGEEISRRTRGHALFVVETLHGLATGTALPSSLQSAVLARIRGLAEPGGAVLRAGAVLGAAFDPRAAAELAGAPLPDALRACEQAHDAGLLTTAGARYEFANDVLRDVLYATTPAPTRLAHHRQAIGMLADQPEQVGEHADAVEDWPRAAHAWLRAGEQALERFAPAEAGSLASRALAAAQRCADQGLIGRSLLLRGRAGYAVGLFGPAWTDLEGAVVAARAVGDRRLELVALRDQSHDVHFALGRPPADSAAPMRECLRIAQALGDRAHEADVLGRLTILATARLDFVQALGHGRRAVDVGRAVGHGRALIHGLDALKAAYAHLGEIDELAPIVAELEPLERADGDLPLLQWTVFESSFIPLLRGDLRGAMRLMEAGLAVNRRSGLTPTEPFFVGHIARLHRLGGNLDSALEAGARAVATAHANPHAWWRASAASQHASTLLHVHRPDEARAVVEPAVAAVDVPGAEAYLLPCLAVLAAATGSADVLRRADELVHSITVPAGSAWLLGADAYLNVARAWRARGQAERAAEVVAPLRVAAARVGWRSGAALADAAVA